MGLTHFDGTEDAEYLRVSAERVVLKLGTECEVPFRVLFDYHRTINRHVLTTVDTLGLLA